MKKEKEEPTNVFTIKKISAQLRLLANVLDDDPEIRNKTLTRRQVLQAVNAAMPGLDLDTEVHLLKPWKPDDNKITLDIANAPPRNNQLPLKFKNSDIKR